MKILLLEDDLVGYAAHLVASRLATGFVTVEEMPTIHAFHEAVQNAKEIDFSNLGKVELEAIGAGGIRLGLEPAGDPRAPQSPGC